MTAVRILLLVVGVWLGWYGISGLFDLPPTDLASVAIWFAGGILLHDAVFAPVCAAFGLTARRLLPPTWWAVTACGAICSVALVLVALPVLDRSNAMSSNPTVLDRDYPLGLTVALLLVWSLVLTAHAVANRSGRRHARIQRRGLRTARATKTGP
ncbi:hypothetical protein ACQP0C_01565 [Nocardia sp. CA-129566]|uniref:hypothetical protein n=1 Tax=Nocardia sp. CA-129566 TaxID=3239976 RepID=UPI003D989404